MDSLATEPLRPVYVLIGTEMILMSLFIKALLQHSQIEDQSLGTSRHRFEEEGADDALFACQTVSLFAEQSIVVLENCTAFLATSKAKHDVSLLEAYLEQPVLERTLVITVDADKVDERKKLAKLAKKHRVIQCTTPKDDEAIPLVKRLAEAEGIHIDPDAIRELWRRAQSIGDCVMELAKLWTYTNCQPIRMADVRELVTPPLEDNVFTWIDSVVRGDVARAFSVLVDVQRGGYDTFALLSMIARQLRLMWFAKTFSDKGYTAQQIATRAGAHPYAVKIATDQSRKFATSRLEKLLLIVADAEYEVKSGRRDMGQALEWVVAACALTMDKRTRAK